jgi:hypothetical protein
MHVQSGLVTHNTSPSTERNVTQSPYRREKTTLFPFFCTDRITPKSIGTAYYMNMARPCQAKLKNLNRSFVDLGRTGQSSFFYYGEDGSLSAVKRRLR